MRFSAGAILLPHRKDDPYNLLNHQDKTEARCGISYLHSEFEIDFYWFDAIAGQALEFINCHRQDS